MLLVSLVVSQGSFAAWQFLRGLIRKKESLVKACSYCARVGDNQLKLKSLRDHCELSHFKLRESDRALLAGSAPGKPDGGLPQKTVSCRRLIPYASARTVVPRNEKKLRKVRTLGLLHSTNTAV